MNLADNDPGEDTSGIKEMIETLEINLYLQIDSPDLDQYMRIDELVRLAF